MLRLEASIPMYVGWPVLKKMKLVEWVILGLPNYSMPPKMEDDLNHFKMEENLN